MTSQPQPVDNPALFKSSRVVVPIGTHRTRVAMFSGLTGLVSVAGDQFWHWLAQRALDDWFARFQAGLGQVICYHINSLH